MITLAEYTDSFPIPLPSDFARAMETIHESAETIGRPWEELCDFVFGFYPVPARWLFPQTPPEMVTFGTFGVDGIHFGFVVHAPELAAGDYPVGELCPMDDDGVIRLGDNIHKALETLFAFERRAAPRADAMPAIFASVGARMGLDTSVDTVSRRYDAQGNGLPILPAVPEGWHYRPTSDGVGVLAPASVFDGRADDRLSRPEADSVESWLARADNAARSGFHATALFFLREVYWHRWPDPEARAVLSERLAQTYIALGRPLLSEVARRRA